MPQIAPDPISKSTCNSTASRNQRLLTSCLSSVFRCRRKPNFPCLRIHKRVKHQSRNLKHQTRFMPLLPVPLSARNLLHQFHLRRNPKLISWNHSTFIHPESLKTPFATWLRISKGRSRSKTGLIVKKVFSNSEESQRVIHLMISLQHISLASKDYLKAS